MEQSTGVRAAAALFGRGGLEAPRHSARRGRRLPAWAGSALSRAGLNSPLGEGPSDRGYTHQRYCRLSLAVPGSAK